jgi:hypothetical protein
MHSGLDKLEEYIACKMRRTFPSLAAFERTVILFEECLESLDPAHRDFLLVSTVNGEAVSSLNDLVRVGGMNAPSGSSFWGVLYYFTPLEVPSDIKREVEDIFEMLFYDAE